jgi:hypothetical protein
VLCSYFRMNHGNPRRSPLCDITNIHRDLTRLEYFITNNRNYIFTIVGRMHSQKEVINTDYVFILEKFVSYWSNTFEDFMGAIKIESNLLMVVFF